MATGKYLTGTRKKAYLHFLKKCVDKSVCNTKVIAAIFGINETRVCKDATDLSIELIGGSITFDEIKFDTSFQGTTKLWNETIEELKLNPDDFNEVSYNADEKEIIVAETLPTPSEDETKKLYNYLSKVSGGLDVSPKLIDSTHYSDMEVWCELFNHKERLKPKYIIPYQYGQSTSSNEQIIHHIERFVNDNAVITSNGNIRKDLNVVIKPGEYSLELIVLTEYCNKNNLHLTVYEMVNAKATPLKVSEPGASSSIVKNIYCNKVEKVKSLTSDIAELIWLSPEDPKTLADNVPIYKLQLTDSNESAHVLLTTSIRKAVAMHSAILIAKYESKLFTTDSIFLDEVLLGKNNMAITRFKYNAPTSSPTHSWQAK